MKELITNNKSQNFYNLLEKLFFKCKSFYISVAFINYSGLQLLLNSLKLCENKKVKGKILTSTYLNFTQAKALRKLNDFSNIELKVFDSSDVGFHSKGYIFEFEDEYKIIIGSSNITASAFKSNIEWNLKVISKKEDFFTKSVLSEFDTLFDKAFAASEEFISSYENFCVSSEVFAKKKFIYKEKISPNSMQEKALENLKYLRESGEKKALAICATGTGKTYLSAFDVNSFENKKVLFLVHRENILIGAKNSFEKVIKNKNFGFFTGNKKELEPEYLFSTVQTMSKNLELFKKDEFDYIIIDEAHHIRSNSYEQITKYFTPKFTLGLTATPNRSDGLNIYEVFDGNIAIDLRLSDAMDAKLVSSFHYFGISDILNYENENLDDLVSLAKFLSVNKRVDYIIEKMNFYGFDGEKRKALGFCVNKEHAKYMSEEFNKKGINSTFLISNDSIEERELVIKKLENKEDPLEIIFSVDIFNEGVDIPSINQILMLRPTNSSIVFTQQLGRGLRKYKNKQYLTLIDFIGNHKRAYLVAQALLGEKLIDKESIKISLKNSFASLSNDTFIQMDKISKEQILTQLEKENFSSINYLREKYFDFKTILNRKPKLIDFLNFENSYDPKNFIDESKSYVEFVQKVEKIKNKFSEDFILVVRFIDAHIKLKRIHEFIILKHLISSEKLNYKDVEKALLKYQEKVEKKTIYHAFRYLNQEFFDSGQIKRYKKLVHIEEEILKKSKIFEEVLKDKKQKELILNSLEYGILLYEKEFGVHYYGIPFLKLYEKYNMKNIALLCNLDKIHSSFRGSGQLKYKNDYFLFINLDKQNAPKSKRYNNTFYSKDIFTWQTKPNASQEKGDGEKLIQNQKHKVNLHIFVRKFITVDKKTQSFIYLGLANCINYEGEKPINLTLQLEKPLSSQLYDEFTLKV